MTEDTTPAAHDSLAGLHRLVTHSRDLLDASNRKPYTLDTVGSSRYAACILAVEVLTMVADCIEVRPEPKAAE